MSQHSTEGPPCRGTGSNHGRKQRITSHRVRDPVPREARAPSEFMLLTSTGASLLSSSLKRGGPEADGCPGLSSSQGSGGACLPDVELGANHTAAPPRCCPHIWGPVPMSEALEASAAAFPLT